MIVRGQQADDYDAIRHVYAEAFRRPRFRRPQEPGSVPPEVALFEALWEAGDVIPELSFTALTDGGRVVGHVTASKASVGADPVVAVGPIGVLPDHQGAGTGSALMNALLAAADAAGVPLIGLLGAPEYYSRFGFLPAAELGVVSPEPEWGDAFQGRPLTAYRESLAGRFQYAPAFSESLRQTGPMAPRVVRFMTIARRVLGALLFLTGVVWVGQGTGLFTGSSMTGSTFWAVTGAVCIVAGLGLLGWPWRQSRASAPS